jgi:hypothetical protein
MHKSHQVHMVNELIHLLEPRIGIRICKVITHGPHQMVCLILIALCKSKKKHCGDSVSCCTTHKNSKHQFCTQL